MQHIKVCEFLKEKAGEFVCTYKWSEEHTYAWLSSIPRTCIWNCKPLVKQFELSEKRMEKYKRRQNEMY